MTTTHSTRLHPDAPIQQGGAIPRELIPSRVAAMLLFVACEVMFFLGLISAHMIASASDAGWPPVGQPRLPVVSTILNTLVLLASGVFLYQAQREYARTGRPATLFKWLTWSVAAGLVFLLVQGSEWLRLIHFGLTVRSSLYGSFFYLIVGAHAVHAVAALLMLVGVWFPLRGGVVRTGLYQASLVFWYFVVGIWPIIFGVVYLR